jgi:uncharacterized protein (TIRG00374 family)
MKNLDKAKIAAVIVSVALIGLLFTQVQVSDVIGVFSTVSYPYLAWGLLFYALAYVFKTVRFRVMLGGSVSLRHLLNVVLVHNMSLVYLPVRTGEVSYVYLLKKHHGVDTGYGIASLFVARVFDIFIMAMLFFISTVYIRHLPLFVDISVWVLAGVLALLALVLGFLAFFKEKFVSVTEGLVRFLGLGRFGFMKYLLRKLSETVHSFSRLRIERNSAGLAASSACIWLTLAIYTYFLLKAFSVNLGLAEAILITSFVALLPFLPIHGIGGFGTTEITISVLLISFGIEKGLAIASSLGTHVMSLLFTTVLGLMGIWIRPPNRA